MPTVQFEAQIGGDNGEVAVSGVSYPPELAGGAAFNLTLDGVGGQFAGKTLDEAGYNSENVVCRWDTSAIPDAAIISAVEVRLYIVAVSLMTSRSFEIGWMDPADWPLDGTESRSDIPSGKEGHTGTSLVTLNGLVGTHVNFAMTSNVATWLNKTGYTAIRTMISGGAPPSLFDSWQVATAQTQHATGDPPTLIVTYTAPQLARPDGDVSDGSWLNEAGSATNLYASVDEAAASNADFIQSSASPGTVDIVKLSLSDVVDPGVSTGHVIRYRYGKANGGGDRIDLTVRLKQGATEIASWTHTNLSGDTLDVEQTLSGGQADAITDYTALELWFEAVKV